MTLLALTMIMKRMVVSPFLSERREVSSDFNPALYDHVERGFVKSTRRTNFFWQVSPGDTARWDCPQLYRYGPCRRSAKWHWVSVGSLFAMVVWLIASAAFSLYVSNFANYDRLYGSLGAVIILLFWLYISFYIVLLGAEINAELELQTAKDTTAGKPRPMGERGRLRRRPRGRWT